MDEDESGKKNRRLISVYRIALYATAVRLVTSAILGFIASVLMFVLDPGKFLTTQMVGYYTVIWVASWAFPTMVVSYTLVGFAIFIVSAHITTRNLVQKFVIDLAAEKILGLNEE